MLLFIPRRMTVRQTGGLFGEFEDEHDPGATLLVELERIRSEYRAAPTKFHFTQISGAKWTVYDRGTYEYVAAGVDALRTAACPRFPSSLHCKLAAIFYPSSTDLDVYGGDRKEKQYRYDETALRMRLKGVLNGLYDSSHRVRVRAIITDGVAAHRPLDVQRILLRALLDGSAGRTPLRNHVAVDPAVRLEPVSSDHKDHEPGSPAHGHAHFLQLADLFLGSLARAAYGQTAPHPVPSVGVLIPGRKKDVIMGPAWDLLEKQRDGSIFGGSYRGAFSASELSFAGGAVTFKPVTVQARASTVGPGSQGSLGFLV